MKGCASTVSRRRGGNSTATRHAVARSPLTTLASSATPCSWPAAVQFSTPRYARAALAASAETRARTARAPSGLKPTSSDASAEKSQCGLKAWRAWRMFCCGLAKRAIVRTCERKGCRPVAWPSLGRRRVCLCPRPLQKKTGGASAQALGGHNARARAEATGPRPCEFGGVCAFVSCAHMQRYSRLGKRSLPGRGEQDQTPH